MDNLNRDTMVQRMPLSGETRGAITDVVFAADANADVIVTEISVPLPNAELGYYESRAA